MGRPPPARRHERGVPGSPRFRDVPGVDSVPYFSELLVDDAIGCG